MESFFEVLDSRSNQARSTAAQPRVGVVASSNPQNGTAKVLLQPEGVLTGWLPVLTQWAGAGWGMACPLAPGDQVLVIPREGDAQHGLIVGCLFSNSTRPPPANAGELTFRHQSGCSIRLLNSGHIAMEGDLHVSGDVFDGHGSLSKLRNHYNAHTHHIWNGGDTSVPLLLD